MTDARLCQRCNAAIPAERVEAVPDTTICVKCSQAIGGEYDLTVVPDSIGKAGSMKKNYGGVTMNKKRKKIWPIKP